MTIKIEPYNRKYLTQILAEQEELYELNFSKTPCPDLEAIQLWYKNDLFIKYVLIYDNKLIGFYLCTINDTVIYLMQIHIIKEYRNLGYGKILMQHFEKLARENNCLYAELEVSMINEYATRFYKNLGYITEKIFDQSGERRQFMIKIITNNSVAENII